MDSKKSSDMDVLKNKSQRHAKEISQIIGDESKIKKEIWSLPAN